MAGVDIYMIVLGLVATVLISLLKQVKWPREVNFAIAFVVAIILGIGKVYIDTGTLANLASNFAVILVTATTAYEFIWKKFEESNLGAKILFLKKEKGLKKAA